MRSALTCTNESSVRCGISTQIGVSAFGALVCAGLFTSSSVNTPVPPMPCFSSAGSKAFSKYASSVVVGAPGLRRYARSS